MLRYILLALIFLAAAGTLSASDKDSYSTEGKSREQIFREIQEFKMKYLAQEMDLKEDQKQQFFDLYAEMCQKRMDAGRTARALEKKVKKDKDATEDDYRAVTTALSQAKAAEAAIEKEYDAKFSKFLTQKQIFKMKDAEESFRKKMEEMRHKKKHKKTKKISSVCPDSIQQTIELNCIYS